MAESVIARLNSNLVHKAMVVFLERCLLGLRKILILNGHMWNWGPIYSARENLRYDFSDLQVRVLNWWETTPQTMSNSSKIVLYFLLTFMQILQKQHVY